MNDDMDLTNDNYAEIDAAFEPVNTDMNADIPVSDDDLMGAVEALLFAAGDPLPLTSMAEILEQSEARVADVCELLADRYENDPTCGLRLRRIESSYLILPDVRFKEVLARLFRPKHRPALTSAAYETLAAIAYNQPATRAQIETVRGVNSDGLVTRLLERGYIEEAGVLEVPGRPMTFQVSDKFLLEFGLSSARDLEPVDLLMYDSIQRLAEAEEEAFSVSRDDE